MRTFWLKGRSKHTRPIISSFMSCISGPLGTYTSRITTFLAPPSSLIRVLIHPLPVAGAANESLSVASQVKNASTRVSNKLASSEAVTASLVHVHHVDINSGSVP
jgi:hypothetical protein